MSARPSATPESGGRAIDDEGVEGEQLVLERLVV